MTDLADCHPEPFDYDTQGKLREGSWAELTSIPKNFFCLRNHFRRLVQFVPDLPQLGGCLAFDKIAMDLNGVSARM